MIRKRGVRDLLEGVGGDAGRFAARFDQLLGLRDARGRRLTDPVGNRALAPKDADRLTPAEVPVRALAEGLLGEDWQDEIPKIPAALQVRDLVAAGRPLLEDDGAGAIMPSAFANINAFTAVVAGLLEVAILEAYQNPEFIADVLAPAEPSRQFEGRKTIGATRIGDQGEERLPGMPTKRVQVGERWITQPRTVENALAAEVTEEAMYLDLTGGQLAEHAGASGVGEWIGYRKEIRVIDSFIGVTTPNQYGAPPGYNYKGSSYNAYIAAGYYDNDFSNELLFESNVEAALIKFRDMTDPDTGTRILISPNTLLVNREKLRTAYGIVGPNAQQAELRTTPGATSGNQDIRIMTPFYKGQYRVLESALVYQRCTATDGLGLTSSNAAKYTWLFESGPKTHVYVQNRPLRTQTAAPNQVDMIDRGIILYVKADERGVPMWKDPRRSVRSKN